MIWRGATALAGAALDLIAPLGSPDWRERLALEGPVIAPGGVWLHAASLGELASVRVLASDLARDLPLVVTTNTTSGRDLARRMGHACALAPLDLPQALRRFLDRTRPSVLVTVENELWPNRSAMTAARGVAQVVVGARISARSAARWRRLPGLIAPMLGRIDALSAQDADSEARLLELGLPPQALTPRLNLKLLAPSQTRPDPEAPDRARVILAASTHDGEDAVVLDAFLAARARQGDLRLILAPRHPARGDAVAALIAARGLPLARRSQGADAQAPVLLADTLGEMERWYRAAGICITGGSLVDHGGHTPWEPAAWRCAIVHGPHVANHAADYADLDAAGAASPVRPAELADLLPQLAGDVACQRRMGAAARAILVARAGDPATLLAQIRHLARGDLVSGAARTDI
ncbi:MULTISPECIES: 3-deoxy-D-manno-octulosonic acid transferase [unclassified Paracoccus (in: a-proteobacteria)]|uniref:3-deoxy-D-manno-octulosonic acid transferase n=1 Tax=unclassified Paracoccus (in: a-proteobacteria) TaxID=2688777 RepID=UPI0021E172F3|nr:MULTISPECIES: glycosyltransferase N-terminal domain-containing protein [unclassified Paracoccus (in: a-proteobacteria)]UXU76045.1 3-deoxy-D-manno-octulosonic acid transferase [Paracoccus sp. SMMA_5]UXU81956.1 3-deoxy-D-manno-octulosonic acid transferase [Paracoccus sp. SMMA_5_TC]